MESFEDRLKRMEIENLTIRENIWELSRRIGIVETLVRSHIVYPGNNVPIDTLLGPVPSMQRDSAAVGELCNRLAKLETLYVQNTHNKGPMSNGPVNLNFGFPQSGMNCGSHRTPSAPLPVFTTVPFNQMQFIPGNIPSNNNTIHNPSIQNHTFGECINNNQQSGDYFQRPPGFFTENSNSNVLEKFFLSGARPTPTITTSDMNTHPKTVDKFGQELSIKSPLATPALNVGGGSGNSEKVKQFTPLSVELAKQAISLPTRCTKLCGKLTGHPCGQVHNSGVSCPPCPVLLKDLKLKCGHEVKNVQCHIKSSRDFKCSKCDKSKIVSQNVSTPPFPILQTAKNETVNQKPMVEPTNTVLNNFTPSAIPINDGSSWMDVAWGDEDEDVNLSTQSSSATTTNTTVTTGISNIKTTENNNTTTSSSESATKTNDQKQFKGNYLSAISSTGAKDDTPLSYAQLVTQQQSSSSSSARNISPASSISGASTTNSKMGFTVEDTVKRYMKVNPQNKANRKNWINNEFKKYTNVQLYSFIRHLTRHSINLSRGTLAGIGQLLNVMIENRFTTNELVIQAFITGVISDLPKIQKDSPNEFELVGENVCYLLVAIFEHENNLNWLVSLGHTLKETKPAIWGIISTTILDIIVHRKGERGFKNLYQQTTTPADMDKSAVLGQVMKALNVRV